MVPGKRTPLQVPWMFSKHMPMIHKKTPGNQGGLEEPQPWRATLHNAVVSANKKAAEAARVTDKNSKLEMYRAVLPWGIGIKSPMLRGKKDTEPWFNRNIFGKRAGRGVEEENDVLLKKHVGNFEVHW